MIRSFARVTSSIRPYAVTRAFSAEAAAPQEPVYVIFGANGGIGSALAAELRTTSSSIVLAGRNVEKMEALRASLGVGTVIQADPLNSGDVDKVITQVRSSPSFHCACLPYTAVDHRPSFTGIQHSECCIGISIERT